jgi:uncharacterized protein YjbI with pentapeptide repeats
VKPLDLLARRARRAPAQVSSLASPASAALDAEDLELLRARWAERDEAGRTRREAVLAELATLRERGEDAVAGPLDLRGLALIDEDLSGLDLSLADLSGADLSRANLAGATLFRGRLAGATLFRANLEGAELSGADLTGANLQNVRARSAGLGMAILMGASLIEADLGEATLTQVDARGADLRMATLAGARLREAVLERADLSKANLRGAELCHAKVARAAFDDADLRGAMLRGIDGYQQARWIGADVREIDFHGAYLCRRFILDQNFLQEFREQGPWAERLYLIWWATSDCGRSLTRWGIWTAALAFLFTGVYAMCDVDYGDHATWLSPLYYSVVTLTTLGYGDVLPASVPAQLAAMVEVCLGYVMLGGLLSIFSNKMARRAE